MSQIFLSNLNFANKLFTFYKTKITQMLGDFKNLLNASSITLAGVSILF